MTFNQLSSINELTIYFGSRQVARANFTLRNKVVFVFNQAMTALCSASIKGLQWRLLSLGATQTLQG